MSTQTQSEQNIYSRVDKEIATNNLESRCHELALQKSAGNYDLMIAIYLITRVEDLKQKEFKNFTKGDALNKRKMHAAKSRIRYQANADSEQDTLKKVYIKRAIAAVSANFILLLGSCGLLLCLWIGNGSNIYEVSYVSLVLIVAAILAAPIIFSCIKVKQRKLPYMQTLIAFCLFVGMGSVALGLNLMKTDPPNYEHLTTAEIEKGSTDSKGTLVFGKPKLDSSVGISE